MSSRRFSPAGRRCWKRLPGSRIAWARLAAAPFALVEVLIEHGNYPDGHELWAWALAGSFTLGALLLVVARHRRPALLAGLVLDLAVVSGFVVLYAFEPGSPVRQLFFLVVVEAALVLGRPGAVAVSLASVPALAVFESRAADRLDVAYDPGHVLGPLAVEVAVGLISATLARRAGSPARGREPPASG